MSSTSRSIPQQQFFDDEPTDSILHNRSSSGSSRASLFTDIYPVLDEIERAAEACNFARAHELIAWLLAGESPMPVSTCMRLVRMLRLVVPPVPKPKLAEAAIKIGPILDDIIVRARSFDATSLQTAAETIAYRWHEGRGEYDKARMVVGSLRERAANAHDKSEIAVMTNNYAYEFLLEGNYSDAEPLFMEALKLFKNLRMTLDMANAQANALSCRFALSPSGEWETMLPELMKSHRVLRDCGDWRVRKTCRLYAERAAAHGKLTVAVAWARKAAAASREIPTLLHQDDENYLNLLERRRDQLPSRGSAVSVDKDVLGERP